MQVLPVIQIEYSDPLHAVDHCQKRSESAVGFVTQWKPSIFAVKILAVHKLCNYSWHQSLDDKTTDANKFTAVKMCNTGCTMDTNICSVCEFQSEIQVWFHKVQIVKYQFSKHLIRHDPIQSFFLLSRQYITWYVIS